MYSGLQPRQTGTGIREFAEISAVHSATVGKPIVYWNSNAADRAYWAAGSADRAFAAAFHIAKKTPHRSIAIGLYKCWGRGAVPFCPTLAASPRGEANVYA